MNGYMDEFCQGNTHSLFKGKMPHSQQYPMLKEQPLGSHSLSRVTLPLTPGATLIRPQVGNAQADQWTDVWSGLKR